jgi:recombination protein RecA
MQLSEITKKKEVLEGAIRTLEKEYGKGIIMRMGDATAVEVETIPSGSIGLDAALGIGGFPKGRIIEIYGPESSGKTTLTLHAIAESQKRGGLAAFIDAEHALDLAYARGIGVNTDDLYVSQPSNGEQALEIVEELVASHALDLIVVDSVAALVPQAEIDGNMGDPQMGLQARLMSQALRKLTGSVSKTGTSIFFINQLRMKIGVMFGNPETTTGGNALKFYASIRLDIRKTDTLKKGDDIYGSRVKVKVVKNKMAPPFRQACFDIIYGTGVSRIAELVEIATEKEILFKTGSWYSFNEERIGQGVDNVKQYLLDHPEIMKQVEEKVFAALLPKPTTTEGRAKAEADKAGVAALEQKPEPKPIPVPQKKPKANEELVL